MSRRAKLPLMKIESGVSPVFLRTPEPGSRLTIQSPRSRSQTSRRSASPASTRSVASFGGVRPAAGSAAQSGEEDHDRDGLEKRRLSSATP